MTVLNTLEADSQTLEKPVAIVQDLGAIQAADGRIRGVLGENFLSHFDLLIDYAHKLLCLDPTTSMRDKVRGERIPLVRPQHQRANCRSWNGWLSRPSLRSWNPADLSPPGFRQRRPASFCTRQGRGHSLVGARYAAKRQPHRGPKGLCSLAATGTANWQTNNERCSVSYARERCEKCPESG